MLTKAFDLAEAAVSAASPLESAAALQGKLLECGVSYFQARLYRRPDGRLTSIRLWEAGGFLARHDPGNWADSSAADYILHCCNPMMEPVARKISRFRYESFAPRRDRRFGEYWDVMSEANIASGIGVLAFGEEEAQASFHIGFPDAATDRDQAAAIEFAGAIAAERLLDFALPCPENADSRLTTRERDVMTYICEGKTDWEIGTILSISEATARFHADNARSKLGATNRAHAAARFVGRYGLF